MKYCLACHRKLVSEPNYHKECLKIFWGEETPIFRLDYKLSEIQKLAKENIAQRIVVTGVQPKLSLGFADTENQNRLTIIGALSGKYILKPPFEPHPQMPEIEALSMLLARACNIATVPFLLIPLKSGELAYLTKRIDRTSRAVKYAMEDACQFTERLTEHKYRGSYEQIAKKIIEYAHDPLLEVVKFYEQVIVSFLIGNNDMHLKNFSLIAYRDNQYLMAPAYDMVAVKLLLPKDPDELALNLNGKKRKLNRNDFNEAMAKSQLPNKAMENLWARIENGMLAWPKLIANSFIKTENRTVLMELIEARSRQVGLTFNNQAS